MGSNPILSESGVVQWLEQWNHNPKVEGSTPSAAMDVTHSISRLYLIRPHFACSKTFILSKSIKSKNIFEKIPIKNNAKIKIENNANSLRSKSLNAVKETDRIFPKKIRLYVHKVYTAPKTILVDAKKVAQKLY